MKLHDSKQRSSKRTMRERTIALPMRRLGYSSAMAMGDAVMREAVRRAEIKSQHGPVKHWKHDENGIMILVD